MSQLVFELCTLSSWIFFVFRIHFSSNSARVSQTNQNIFYSLDKLATTCNFARLFGSFLCICVNVIKNKNVICINCFKGSLHTGWQIWIFWVGGVQIQNLHELLSILYLHVLYLHVVMKILYLHTQLIQNFNLTKVFTCIDKTRHILILLWLTLSLHCIYLIWIFLLRTTNNVLLFNYHDTWCSAERSERDHEQMHSAYMYLIKYNVNTKHNHVYVIWINFEFTGWV